MRKSIFAVFGALLISGMTVQAAAATTHHRSKAYFGRDLSDFRRAYNPVNGPASVIPRAPDRFDPSRPGAEDPVLNPSGS